MKLVLTSVARRVTAVCLGSMILWAGMCSVRAADSAFVGVLALAVEPDVARSLGLSDTTLKKLRELVARRENEAVNLVLEIRQLPPAERQVRMRAFAQASEKEGLKLLTLEQRSRLDQIRIARAGMKTLAEPGMARMLKLSDEQRAQVDRLLAERKSKMASSGEREQRRVRDDFERKLRNLLTPEQQALWDSLAGRRGAVVQGSQAAPSGPPKAMTGTGTSKTPNALKENESKVAASPTKPAASSSKQEPNSPSDRPSPAVVPPASDQPRVARASRPSGPVKLQFNFQQAPWKDVLEWLAAEAGLSMQVDTFPEGTFNYRDTREYTPAEAIDLINSVLVTKGYTLLRRERLLTVLFLDAENPIPDILVDFVPMEKLDERGDFELVKTVFQLAQLDPSELEGEIRPLLGPGRTMVVLPKSRQILVTETAGKLRLIRDIIARAENPKTVGGGMVEIELKHASADDVLEIVRPLFGLEEESTRNDEIQIASDTAGSRLFITGKPEKVQLVRDIVERIDKPDTGGSDVQVATPYLRTYAIRAADPTTVMSVLQTLLSGMPDVRLGLDETNHKLIAMARPSEHKLIAETLQKLEGEAPHFEIIPLGRLDGQLVMATIQNFFGGGSSGSSGSGGEEGSKGQTASPDGPVVEIDPTFSRLFVRGTDTQIAQIRQMLESLEKSQAATGEGKLRLIPLPAEDAAEVVERAKRFWTGGNRVELLVPSDGNRPSLLDMRTPAESSPSMPKRSEGSARSQPERAEKSPRETTPKDKGDRKGPKKTAPPKTTRLPFPEHGRVTERGGVLPGGLVFASQRVGATQEAPPAPQKGAPIRVEVTSQGILLYSDDEEALDQFETLLRKLAGPTTGATRRKFTVFFLKHAKAEVALQLLQDILGGGSSSGGSLIGDVTSGLLSGGGGILGALMGAAGGGGSEPSGSATLQGIGPISLVADPRLNAIVVQALPADLRMLEDLLKVIDREDSMTPVEMTGRPRPIMLTFISADDAANIIKQVFADRVAGQQQQQRGGQPNPAELIRALRGGGRGGRNQQAKGELPKMTVAVDNRANAVIVTAPEQLFRQVEELVKQIDQPVPESTDKIEVVTLKSADPELVQQALQSLLQTEQKSATSGNTTAGRPGGGTSTVLPFGGGNTSPEAIRRRIEFFRQMRQRGGFGRPGGGSGRPGGRPSPRGSSRGR